MINSVMRIIAHLDMDAFFASVEERDNPRFRGKPLVVGADPKGGEGRGVVSTANYKAREYGIHSAMPISQAWRFAEEAHAAGKPAAVFCAVNMKKYGEVSGRIMTIVAEKVPLVEQTSIDEAYLDLSFAGTYAAAEKIAREIKEIIAKKERLTTTVGIGPNRLIAKIATEMHKPDGLTVIRGEEAAGTLAPLPLRAIPGVGPKTEALFARRGARFVRDLLPFSCEALRELCGAWGAQLYEHLRGRDDAPVGVEEEAKSIGEQETFEKDAGEPSFVSARVRALADAVVARLARQGFSAFRRAVLTVRFADFTTKTKSRTFPVACASADALAFEMLKLLIPFFDARENPAKKPIRLVGVRVEGLE